MKVCGNSIEAEAVDEDKETVFSGNSRASASSYKWNQNCKCMHKTCASSSQTKFQHGEDMGMKSHL